MNKNRRIARDLYVIGAINALTGYYGLHYINDAGKARNKVTFDQGIVVESEIGIQSNEQKYYHKTGIPYINLEAPQEFNDYIVMQYIQEINLIKVNVKRDNNELGQIVVKKEYIGDTYNDVLNPDTSFEKKQSFLLDSLDKIGRKTFIFPKNKAFNFTKEEQKELAFVAMDMTRWLEFKVREEQEAKKLIK